MATWDGNNFYFSGQGVVLIGKRQADGKPAGLLPVGNVSDLKISIATTVLEHKESQTGQRGIDLRLTTETKATLSCTMENFIAKNLALAVRGDHTDKLGSSVTNENTKLYFGKVVPTKYAKISSVTVARLAGPTVLAAYASAGSPWDYKLNLDAGSIQFNDGRGNGGGFVAGELQTAAMTTAGTTITSVTVGNPTILVVANTASVGDKVAVNGTTGADAALLNLQAFDIVAASPTQVSINVDTTGKTITGGGSSLASFDGQGTDVDYSFAGQQIVDGLTQGSLERFLRFEGLNTADENRAVTVEVFKFLVDPLKELALISDTIGQFVLEGNVLADPLQLVGSKYFKQTLLR